jgi:TP901 family phage tail tape measure protein
MAEGIKIGDAILEFIGDDAQLQSVLGNLKGGLQAGIGGAALAAGQQMGQMGDQILGTLGGMVDGAVQFGDAMAEVNTLGIEDLGALSDAVKKVSEEFAVDLTDGAKAAYQAISAGASEAEAPLVLEKAAKAATAGVSDLTTAIGLGTGVANAFGVEFEDIEVIFDQAFVAVKNGVTTFDELASAVGKVAPTMKGMGLSTEELFASVSALTKAGMNTAESVTGLKAALSNIITPSGDAQKAAKELEIVFSAAALESKGLAQFLAELGEATGGNIETMSRFFGSVEGLNAVMALTGAQAEDFNNTLAEMQSATGATDRAFQAFVDASPGFEFERLKAVLASLAVEMGEALLPILIDAARAFIPIAKATVEFVRENEELVKVVLMVVGALGAVMAILGPILVFIGTLGLAVAGLGPIFAALAAALGVIFAPIALVVAALIGAVVAIALQWDEFKEGAIILWEAVVGVFTAAWEAITAIVAGGASAVVSALQAFVDTLKFIIRDGPVAIWQGVADVFKAGWEMVIGIWNAGADVVKGSAKAFMDFLKTVWEGARAAFDWAAGMLDAGWSKIVGVFEWARDTIASIGQAIMDAMRAPFDKAAEFVNWLRGIFGGGGGGSNVQQFARGGTAMASGPSILGEGGGPELVFGPGLANVAAGSRVLNARDTAAVIGGGGKNVEVNIAFPNANFNSPEMARWLSRRMVRDVQSELESQGERFED